MEEHTCIHRAAVGYHTIIPRSTLRLDSLWTCRRSSCLIKIEDRYGVRFHTTNSSCPKVRSKQNEILLFMPKMKREFGEAHY
jgi:hypothetical protein